MGPKDTGNTNETNGDTPVAKGKRKARSHNSSAASLVKITPDDVDAGIATLNNLSRIFSFLNTYHTDIEELDRIYGLQIRQQERIEFLERAQNDVVIRKENEMLRLQQENENYQARISRLEKERSEVVKARTTLDEKLVAKENEMQIKMDKEKEETTEELNEKHNRAVEQTRKEHERQIKDMETSNEELKKTINMLEKKNDGAQQILAEQSEKFDIQVQSYHSKIKALNTEIAQMNASSVVVHQLPQFYIDEFKRLQSAIEDVAVNDFKFVPHEAKLLDTDEIRHQLITASPIFGYPPLSSEDPVATFLRTCAIQNFISEKLVSIIKRQYYVVKSTADDDQKPVLDTTDSILDAISNVPAATTIQDLSWRLTTVDKLDRLQSHFPSTQSSPIVTAPDQSKIVQDIIARFHHFRSAADSQLQPRLAQIVSTAIKIWGALRKDDCQVEFDISPSTADGRSWSFVDYHDESGNVIDESLPPSEIDPTQLPSMSFVLFPRITGVFTGDDSGKAYVLHRGVALPHDSSTFEEGLKEKQHANETIEKTMKDLKRGRRALSNAQPSPVVDRRSRDWPTSGK